MTRSECLIYAFLCIAMIAAGLTWLYGPWGLIGTGAAVLVGMLIFIDVEDAGHEEGKPNA